MSNTEEDVDDPFSCFGSDDDESESGDDQPKIKPSKSSPGLNIQPTPTSTSNSSSSSSDPKDPQHTRDEESCGVLCFHPHTEQSLLVNVKNKLNQWNKLKGTRVVQTSRDGDGDNDGESDGDNNGDNDGEKVHDHEQVLKAIDEYCQTVHWMMHIGPEKKSIIQETLQSAMDAKIKKHLNSNPGMDVNTDADADKAGSKPICRFICVELGTYCGYGSICLASMMRNIQQSYMNMKNMNVDVQFHLFTVEINPQFTKIAKEMIRLAKLESYITVLQNDLLLNGTTGNVSDLIQKAIMDKYAYGSTRTIHNISGTLNDTCTLDFIMIDHDKDEYLSDLQCMESNKTGLIKNGTTVVADNVIFAQIDNYISYMKELEEKGIVRTKTKKTNVEYSLGSTSASASTTELEDGNVHTDSGSDSQLLIDGIGK